MQKNEIRQLVLSLFEKDINEEKFRDFEFKKNFSKKILKTNGKELYNLLNKIIEILESNDLSFYKNLKYDLKKYKRCSTIKDSWHIFSRKYCFM